MFSQDAANIWSKRKEFFDGEISREAPHAPEQ
jgi:hypothetical protein